MKKMPGVIGSFLLLSTIALAGSGYTVQKGDSFTTRAVPMGKLGNTPYAFRISGTGRPGRVAVSILDGKGRVVRKTTGRFTGTCPGKPTITTFAELGYSESSEVRTSPENKYTLVTIDCGRGSRIEFACFPPIGTKLL